jgi:hypothetical protein
MKRYLRQLIFLMHAFVLRWPIWMLVWAIGRAGLVKTIFLIYPTDTAECLDFCPNIPWLRHFFSGRPTLAGMIMNGWLPVGLYLVIPNPALELMRKKNRPLVELIVKRMRWIQKLSGARTIGLAGQLGPIFEKRHGIPMQPPFYASTLGNIYSIQEAIRHMAKDTGKPFWQVTVAILGGGELGEQLREYLSGDGYQLSMVGVRYTRRGDVKLADKDKTDKQLRDVDFVINLLPRGRDFLACRLGERICKSASIIDFSRPQIPTQQIKQRIIMGNRVQRRGIHFFMKLPGGWQRHELPACSMPCLLAALTGFNAENLTEFRLAAQQFAFQTALAGAPLPLWAVFWKRLHRYCDELRMVGSFALFLAKSRL